jgi:GcrA cell cycle regulator
MNWTDEIRRAVCDAFYRDCESASLIAGRIGVSRNAVIGCAHRHGKRFGYTKLKGAPRQVVKRTRGKDVRPRQTARSAPVRPQPPRPVSDAKPKPLPPAPELPAEPLRLALAGLGTRNCRFPVTPHHAPPAGHRFCGLTVADGFVYCAAHARLAYQPAAERRQTRNRGGH